jgi:hypothetical protein
MASWTFHQLNPFRIPSPTRQRGGPPGDSGPIRPRGGNGRNLKVSPFFGKWRAIVVPLADASG